MASVSPTKMISTEIFTATELHSPLSRQPTEANGSQNCLLPGDSPSSSNITTLPIRTYHELMQCGVTYPQHFITKIKNIQKNLTEPAENSSKNLSKLGYKIEASDNNHVTYADYDLAYVVMRQLGAGAQSQVSQVKEISLNDDRPIKFKAAKESKISFSPEAKLLKKLPKDAPENNFIDHIEKLLCINHKAVKFQGKKYLAIHQISDGDLKSFNFTGPENPLSTIILQIQDFAHGLLFLHENDIIHRDIKGANLLVNHNGPGKITDFGTARDIPKEGEIHSTSYSHFYVAPFTWQTIEQKVNGIEGHQNKAGDVFSFGRMLQYDVIKPALEQLGDKHGVDTSSLINQIDPTKISVLQDPNITLETLENQHPNRVVYKNSYGQINAMIFPKRVQLLKTSLKAIKLFHNHLPTHEILIWKGLARLAHSLQATNPNKIPSMNKVTTTLSRLIHENVKIEALPTELSISPRRTFSKVPNREFVPKKLDFSDRANVETQFTSTSQHLVLIPQRTLKRPRDIDSFSSSPNKRLKT